VGSVSGSTGGSDSTGGDGERVTGAAGACMGAAADTREVGHCGPVSALQSCQPGGGVGHFGSGTQSEAGFQPAGGCGQPGGLLKRALMLIPLASRTSLQTVISPLLYANH
jgi:hypothetical protein